MARDIGIENHRAWLGYLQPVGLVVSPHALVQCQAYLDLNVFEDQIALRSLMSKHSQQDSEIFYLSPDRFIELFVKVLGWRETDLKTGAESGDFASLFLPEYQESILATHLVFEKKSDPTPTALGLFLDRDEDLDAHSQTATWKASHQVKFERLLREKNVAIGFILTPSRFRLIFAPKGESSGYVTFPFHLMLEVQGRIVLAAFKMLMNEGRWFTLPSNARLPALLLESRKYQNVVSTQLSEQVLAALYELLRGLQNADNHRKGALLKEVLQNNRNDVYHGCLTVLLRTVFLLYAEDRELIPAHPIYAENYSIKGLFERLRSDESRYSDTMDQRFGAWAQLITLFRIVYEGIDFPGFRLPARHGHLFNPDRFLFLEGRVLESDPIDPPFISDGILFRILSNLMMLDGERISYRTLDVEQIGSVYETVMGFQLEIATGPSVAIKSKKANGAPTVIDLQALLELKKVDRAKELLERTEQDINGSAIADAKSIDELEIALDKKISRIATPVIVSKGAMILQPSDERRKSGSHYTPRSLTEPIVRRALEPIFSQFKGDPTPEQILNLKLCDPAMGSGAFLVESIRQLSEALVRSWRIHQLTPNLPFDEDELLFARRQIAQRCIYGVDKNPMAVDLAKLSLWLATFAKDHSFTFLDHSLKCGDSLVGLSLDQISKGTWEDTEQNGLFTQRVMDAVDEYTELRREISFASEDKDYEALVQLNEEAQQQVQKLRASGDLILSAFFSGGTAKERKVAVLQVQSTLLKIFQTDTHFEYGSVLPKGLRSFHWELEFPEVFQRENGGFDLFIGNPPFAGKNTLSSSNVLFYLDWLQTIHPQSNGNADLVAHFFRMGIKKTRTNGTLNLIATNTIRQGDTRESGLCYILEHENACIFSAQRRFDWPGPVAVSVSIIHILKNRRYSGKITLDNIAVKFISAFLFNGGTNRTPARLVSNSKHSFIGYGIYGAGFTFEDENDTANTLQKYRELASSKVYSPFLFPYLGGSEFLTDPQQQHSRYVINFGQISEEEAKKIKELYEIVRSKVKPERDKLPNTNSTSRLQKNSKNS